MKHVIFKALTKQIDKLHRALDDEQSDLKPLEYLWAEASTCELRQAEDEMQKLKMLLPKISGKKMAVPKTARKTGVDSKQELSIAREHRTGISISILCSAHGSDGEPRRAIPSLDTETSTLLLRSTGPLQSGKQADEFQ
jgi:hypothetical protein